MIRHVVDRDEFMPLSGNDAGDVFLHLGIVFGGDETLAALDGKDDVDVNLGVGVGHEGRMAVPIEHATNFFSGATKMPPRWGSGFLGNGATKMPRLRRYEYAMADRRKDKTGAIRRLLP
jgi:hypothetical protein